MLLLHTILLLLAWTFIHAFNSVDDGTVTIFRKWRFAGDVWSPSVLFPSVPWLCWLGGRKGIQPIKTEWWDVGVVICLGWGAYLHMDQQMPVLLIISCSSKPRLVLPFCCRLTRVVPDKMQKSSKNDCMCVWSPVDYCVVCVMAIEYDEHNSQDLHQMLFSDKDQQVLIMSCRLGWSLLSVIVLLFVFWWFV